MTSMARRSLRKIDPALDLSYHLRTWEQLPRPWNPRALWGRCAPLEVDVGSGKGLFLRTAAARQPERDFLGIELSRKYARFTAATLAKLGLRNALVVVADALRVFAEVLPDASLEVVHLYFPDPWWKKRHHKRRLLRDSFVGDLARTLRPGGRLHFWTDVADYFRLGLELIAARTDLVGPQPVPELPATHDLDYRTHFERRVRLQHAQVFRAEFQKAPA
jgi:tRNA (guanine-N7-)-methyltransferase